MRLPLASTLKTRDGTLDKDARLLNAVVDTKQRVLKRPGLIATYEVATPGAGLGLFVINTPERPDAASGDELVVIAGSVLTTTPPEFVNVNFTLTAGTINAAGIFGLLTSSAIGSINPTSFDGGTITEFYTSNPPTYVADTQLLITGAHAQSAFTSITFNGITLLSADVSEFSSGSNTLWRWASALITAAGTYPGNIS